MVNQKTTRGASRKYQVNAIGKAREKKRTKPWKTSETGERSEARVKAPSSTTSAERKLGTFDCMSI